MMEQTRVFTNKLNYIYKTKNISGTKLLVMAVANLNTAF